MNRHHGAQGRSQSLALDSDTDRPGRARRHDGVRDPQAHDDTWRKHPMKSLDAELSLLPLWRRSPERR